jgi:hypothetical protein
MLIDPRIDWILLCRLRVISRNLSLVSKSNVFVPDDMSERAKSEAVVIRVADGKAMQTWNARISKTPLTKLFGDLKILSFRKFSGSKMAFLTIAQNSSL